MVTEAVDVALAPPLEALLAPAGYSGVDRHWAEPTSWGNNTGKLQSTWLQLQVEESNDKYYLGLEETGGLGLEEKGGLGLEEKGLVWFGLVERRRPPRKGCPVPRGVSLRRQLSY
eukprot:gene16805-biopygen3813